MRGPHAANFPVLKPPTPRLQTVRLTASLAQSAEPESPFMEASTATVCGTTALSGALPTPTSMVPAEGGQGT
jgi:hypothetical protein